MIKSSKIKPFLWFDTQAEEAAKFYVSVFRRSKLGAITRYPAGSPGPVGKVMTVAFRLEGQDFVALNGGPQYKFTEAVSLLVECRDQKEIDYYWKKLTARGGKPVACGWLRDRYGLFWQVAPRRILEYYSGRDRRKAERVMQAMMKMVKLDIAKLEEAAR
jgi:predicted 3-demethylubiquinone-9 3-methyltransferase (glyoxalase superfamily)